MGGITVFPDIDYRIKEAVAYFWNTRDRQTGDGGPGGHGNRGAVTGGRQLDGFTELIKRMLVANGVDERHIFLDTKLELPGYYRPSKKWDLLVVDKGRLVTAVELKSQVGPSFGNNFNNRTEEAVGSASDIWTAYREGVFKDSAPWLGYMMLLEDCKGSSSPVSVRSPHFDVMEGFEGSSYMKRYEMFCGRLVSERLYNASCLITSERNPGDPGNYKVPCGGLSFPKFIASMLAAVSAHLAGNEWEGWE